MAQKIENHQTTAALQNPVCRCEGFLRMNGVMQGLAEDRKVDAVLRDWRIFNIAQPVLEIFEAMLFRQLRAELDHFRRIVDRDDLARILRKQLRQRSLACPE